MVPFNRSSRRFTSSITIDGNNPQVICKALKHASLQYGNKCRRWGRQVQAYTFRVIQNFNIIIPKGSYNKGCSDTTVKIQNFLGPCPNPRLHLYADKSRSFKEAARISNCQA
ncbi:hypothetical protein H5410_021481 [Solanum commersonii]|uniref:Uncharacterized protein n=1 Tax=Solanum commersonii TaxID=4109 RepID=A0A9J5ZED7_SOLCO|nr:hypothetical protein H5410_021481 [Solanum commersonii]